MNNLYPDQMAAILDLTRQLAEWANRHPDAYLTVKGVILVNSEDQSTVGALEDVDGGVWSFKPHNTLDEMLKPFRGA